jgi:predicted nucleotidyltransferase
MRSLAETSLSADERALLERFAVILRARLSSELHAVWLFGSRARGEPPEHGDSDVDVLVLVDDATWDGKRRVHAAFDQAALELGLEDLSPWFSVHIDTPEWLQGRRAIRSFLSPRSTATRSWSRVQVEPALGGVPRRCPAPTGCRQERSQRRFRHGI